MKKILPYLLVSLSFFSSAHSYSQLVINEYSASNKDLLIDAQGDYPDWLELYNSSASQINLSGYYLSDKVTNLQKWSFPALNLAAGQHLLIFASGKDAVFGTEYHTNFKLTQMKGDKIILSDAGGTILDSLTLLPAQKNHSRGRTVDGGPNWGVLPNPTPGSMNFGVLQNYSSKVLFSLAPGFYPGAQTLSLSCPDPNVQIRYTLNGDVPGPASALYTGPLTISSTTIVRAASISNNAQIPQSFTESNTYFIGANHHKLAVISVASPDYSDLFQNLVWEAMTSMEYFDTLGQLQFEMEGDMRPHGNDSWSYPQKGIRFYTRDEYGYDNNVSFKLFNSSPRNEFDVFILKAGASDNFPGGFQSGLLSCHLRDVFAQTLSEKHGLNLDVRRWEPCVLYINGQYWGIYEIRERVDADYTDYYYDQGQDSVDMLAYWGGLTIEEGSDTGWNNLVNFMRTQNLAIQSNYDFVQSQFEVMSLIDYFILNTFLVDTDWLNWNTAWWRGRSLPIKKWRYRLWDEDNIWNLGQNYTGVGTPTYLNDPCDPTTLFQGDPDIPHTDMLNALMANPQFHDLYINRYADLLNSVFRCDTMLGHLQWIQNRLAPEMPQHCTRWSGLTTDWYDNLNAIRVQINGRCSVVDSLMVGCYNLTGPYDITVLVDPPGSGDVRVNTIIPAQYPFTGSYYGGVTMNLSAVMSQGHPLIIWTNSHHTLSPTIYDDTVSLSLTMGDTIIAHFDTNQTVMREPVANLYWFRAYPSLVTQKLFVEFRMPAGLQADQTLILTDLSGHILADFSEILKQPGNTGRIELDLSDMKLAKGIYMLQFRSGSYHRAEKIIWAGE